MNKPIWRNNCAILLLCAASVGTAPAQNFHSVLSFNGTNGQSPQGPLVQGADGNFYGVTEYGGSNGLGTVFRITPRGTLTTMQSFGTTADFLPAAGLILATDGSFYGTTSNNYAFKLTPENTLTALSGQLSSIPVAPLMQAADGNFYGTTSLGAGNFFGMVFKMTPEGVLTDLHDFDETDGGRASAGLAQAPDGNLYGTTEYYGANYDYCYIFGCGTLFKITPSGTLTTLANFDYGHGVHPAGSLLMDMAGNAYGTASQGGASANCEYGTACGTIFMATPDGALSRLHSFDYTDGASPTGPLVLASDGNFYGKHRPAALTVMARSLNSAVQAPLPLCTVSMRRMAPALDH